MFYCDRCAEDAGWPIGGGVPRSRGPCECCEVMSINTDIPCRALGAAKLPMSRAAIWERRGWSVDPLYPNVLKTTDGPRLSDLLKQA